MTIGATLLPAIDALAARVSATAGGLADLRAAAAALDPPRKPTGVRSGLPWASGKRHGNIFRAVLEPATASFEAMRHRPADFELVFVDNWKTTTAATWMAGCNPLKPASALPWLAGQDIAVVLTVPLFPAGGLTGTLPEGKKRFKEVAEGKYDPVHQALAGGFAASGVRVIGMRIGWEVNSSYPWSHALCEGDYALWRDAYRHVAALWKERFPRALVSLNFLRSFAVRAPDPGFTLDTLLEGDLGWFDVLGADCYTNQLDKGATPADVRDYLKAGTPDRPLGPMMWAAAAAARGKLYECSEWAAARPVFPADDPTRDLATFPAQMFDHFLAANPAWEAYFQNDDPGTEGTPGPGLHNIDPGPKLPNTRAGYAGRWSLAYIDP